MVGTDMVVGHLQSDEFFPGELAAELAPGENTWLPVLGSRGLQKFKVGRCIK